MYGVTMCAFYEESDEFLGEEEHVTFLLIANLSTKLEIDIRA